MLALITMPSATTTFTSMSDYSSGLFTELLTPVLVLAGLLIGGFLLAKFVGVVKSSIKAAFGGRKGGRRRRR